MKAEAVENNRQTCLKPMSKGALVGAAVGFATKYAYPLNNDEKKSPSYRRAMAAIEEQKSKYGPETQAFIEEINSKDSRSLAEDVFVKMFEGVKEGEKLPNSRIRKAMADIRNSNPDFMQEFKALAQELKSIAEMNAKQGIKACNFAMKHARPTSFFLVGGAVVGAIIGLFRNILRTDVQYYK